MTQEALQNNLLRLIDRIESAKARAGRRDEIAIVPATKCVDRETVSLLPSLGLNAAGENRAQELLLKCDLPLCWHFIGNLQTNKVKALAGKVQWIQSVDRLPLAEEIEKRFGSVNEVVNVLIEVNAGEANKGGVSPNELTALAEKVSRMPHLRLRGLMSVLPKEAKTREYERIAKLYEDMRGAFGLSVFSMGMSEDLDIAIECGSTMVRPGRALFGPRV